ncbi:hypothetical protein Mth01_07770 [Sphaerimonospora thailandensis]|uniref:Uncharacterized protein n=1 Tax=Sphaerimonospora thailandensis TaxID=795644 RepID=A0A8J3VX41_9ACTN|nr:hypothetical protein Mth01_07770 [Sphaerimonospora thailandensis]
MAAAFAGDVVAAVSVTATAVAERRAVSEVLSLMPYKSAGHAGWFALLREFRGIPTWRCHGADRRSVN